MSAQAFCKGAECPRHSLLRKELVAHAATNGMKVGLVAHDTRRVQRRPILECFELRVPVLHTRAQAVRKGVLDSAACRPTPFGKGGSIRTWSPEPGRRVGVGDLANDHSARRVEQGAIERQADASADRAQPVDLGFCGDRQRSVRDGSSTLDAGALDVSLDTPNDSSDLIVEADVATPDDTVDVVGQPVAGQAAEAAELERRAVVEEEAGPIPAPSAADLKTSIEPRPGEN